ncbi:putative universal stress protein family [Peptoclostridium acidaminophilum DSM 3953]|uniref:Universal stress protein n=1 Tax=Peptoclostridium acidaminophilum DSM 3953 TaxID=1286171 RepID=W8TGF0_PEPAC|nr:universal stress protein [Peptoclostridium acidaminophilum]AHM56908.1 putative universal stress protein family [Peptoclostridium acidaminophilum DSM 3953]
MEIKKILVPVDGSEANKKAIEFAAEMAKKFPAQVLLMHVIELNMPSALQVEYSYVQYSYTDEDLKNLKDISRKILDNAKEMLEGVEVSTFSYVGYPVDEILRVSEEEDVDMIVMASRGMSGIKKYLMGSVTNNVVHHSKKPVLVIP